jgi:hypothetical protein
VGGLQGAVPCPRPSRKRFRRRGSSISPGFAAINLFEPYKSTAGNDLIYDPRAHDGGATAVLFAQCGCRNYDVESCRLVVHVKLQWQDPTYTLVQGYTFTSCLSCRVEDDEGDRLG